MSNFKKLYESVSGFNRKEIEKRFISGDPNQFKYDDFEEGYTYKTKHVSLREEDIEYLYKIRKNIDRIFAQLNFTFKSKPD